MTNLKYPFYYYGLAYELAGWHPLPAEGKEVRVKGCHGHKPVKTFADIKKDNEQWLRQLNSAKPLNLAVRLPETIIALDIDAYKGDLEKLAALEAKYGPLPPTWNSDSRGGKGGKLLYRVPQGFYSRAEVGGITICHHNIRYIMVFPSWNPESASMYLWYDPGSNVREGEIPTPDAIPMLPELWLKALEVAAPEHIEYDGKPMSVAEIEPELLHGESGVIDPYMQTWADKLDAQLQQADHKHPECWHALCTLVGVAADGHRGLDVAAQQLFETYVAFQRPRDMAADFHSMLGHAVAKHGPISHVDPCTVTLVIEPQTNWAWRDLIPKQTITCPKTFPLSLFRRDQGHAGFISFMKNCDAWVCDVCRSDRFAEALQYLMEFQNGPYYVINHSKSAVTQALSRHKSDHFTFSLADKRNFVVASTQLKGRGWVFEEVSKRETAEALVQVFPSIRGLWQRGWKLPQPVKKWGVTTVKAWPVGREKLQKALTDSGLGISIDEWIALPDDEIQRIASIISVHLGTEMMLTLKGSR